jgi:hypothetical protein
MKLYVWTEAFVRRTPDKPTAWRVTRSREEVFIAVVADSLKLAIANIEASYRNQFGEECPWDLTQPDKTTDPAHKEACILFM